jgi:transcriptional regulator with XRE-family HTH domain
VKERIKNLLASNMKASDIATVVGCSPAYITQLWNNEDFRAEVEALRIANQTEKTEEEHIDNRLQNLTHKILNNIERTLPEAELPQLTRALEVVGKMQIEKKRDRAPVVATPAGGNIYITQIALPQHALNHTPPVVQVNEKNEIIAIDNKPLAPMSSVGVKNIFQQMKEKATQAAQQVITDSKVLQEI